MTVAEGAAELAWEAVGEGGRLGIRRSSVPWFSGDPVATGAVRTSGADCAVASDGHQSSESPRITPATTRPAVAPDPDLPSMRAGERAACQERAAAHPREKACKRARHGAPRERASVPRIHKPGCSGTRPKGWPRTRPSGMSPGGCPRPEEPPRPRPRGPPPRSEPRRTPLRPLGPRTPRRGRSPPSPRARPPLGDAAPTLRAPGSSRA